MTDCETKLVPYLRYSETTRGIGDRTRYASVRIEYRESVDEAGTFAKSEDQRTLQDIAYEGFVSEYNFESGRFIGWQSPHYEGYHPGIADLERAAKLAKQMERKLDKFRSQFGCASFGQLAAMLAAAYRCKSMLMYDSDKRETRVLSVASVTGFIDRRIAAMIEASPAAAA